MACILVVEDDHEVRQLIREMLRRHGHAVVEATNGQTALEQITSDHLSIDLIITDVVMPKMSGPELARILSVLRPGLGVLYISGYLDDRLIEHGLSAEEPNFLRKPFTREELIQKVERMTEARMAPATLAHAACRNA